MNDEKIKIINELCDIPYNSGRDFIKVSLDLPNMVSGVVNFGFGWKKDIGEIYFNSLDSCIEKIKMLKDDLYKEE